MSLAWGVVPLLIKKQDTTEDLFDEAAHAVERAGYIMRGDVAVLTAGVPLGIAGRTNMIRVIEV